jgi:hypothetical protein
MLVNCAIGKRLTDAWLEASQDHSAAQANANALRGLVSPDELADLTAEVRRRRNVAEAVQAALDRHRKEHGC